jgi:hypothetical protein
MIIDDPKVIANTCALEDVYIEDKLRQLMKSVKAAHAIHTNSN